MDFRAEVYETLGRDARMTAGHVALSRLLVSSFSWFHESNQTEILCLKVGVFGCLGASVVGMLV